MISCQCVTDTAPSGRLVIVALCGAHVEVVREELAAAEKRRSETPTPTLIWCPACKGRHIDEGEFATKPHHTHACQHCGMVFRVAIGPTVGVQFLPGFKNEVTS